MPAIVRWPGVVPAGVESDQPCITFDFTASIARIAGAAPAADRPLEGIDIIAHVAQGRPDVERTLYWRKPRGETVWKGVRQAALKYVAKQEEGDEQEFLFDLAADPAEQTDLKDQRSADFQRLKSLYRQWEQDTRKNRRGRP